MNVPYITSEELVREIINLTREINELLAEANRQEMGVTITTNWITDKDRPPKIDIELSRKLGGTR